jgi:hypothetical protein
MEFTLSSHAYCSRNVIFSEQKRRPSPEDFMREKRHLHGPVEFNDVNSLSKGQGSRRTEKSLSSSFPKTQTHDALLFVYVRPVYFQADSTCETLRIGLPPVRKVTSALSRPLD